MNSCYRKAYFTLITAFLINANGCATVPATYVAADRATYNAIAPEYRAYVGADAALTEPQKELRIMTLESWERRITAAEEEQK